MLWYGKSLCVYAQFAYEGTVEDSRSFAVVPIIFVMVLIEVFLSIMGVYASKKGNQSTDIQVYMLIVFVQCHLKKLSHGILSYYWPRTGKTTFKF